MKHFCSKRTTRSVYKSWDNCVSCVFLMEMFVDVV